MSFESNQRPTFRETIRNVSLISWFLLVLIGAVTAGVYYAQMKFWRLSLESNETKVVDLVIERIGADFEPALADLLTLSETPELQAYIEHSGEAERAALGDMFLRWSRVKSDYFKMRFLDESGVEVARVNNNHGSPYIVPLEKLQNKSNRYFFTEAFKLAKGQMFITPFDLNIDGGKIEEPPHPTIRFCIPVFDRQERKRGVLLINYEGRKILRRFQEETSGSAGHAVLLNSEGYWLRGTKSEDEWGFMTPAGKEKTFGKAFPAAWSRISGNESGTFYNQDGFFAFRTMYPMAEVQRFVLNRVKGDPFPLGRIESYQWKIVSFVPEATLQAKSHGNLSRLALVDSLFLVILLVGSWVQANARVNSRRAAASLKRQAELLDLAHDAIIVWDMHQRIIFWNRGAEGLYGWLREEAIGKSVSALLHSRCPELIEGIQDELLRQGHWSGEVTGNRRDGAEVTTFARLALQRGPRGNPLAILAIVTDISERKRSEELLRESEEMFRAVAETASDAIVSLDSQGNIAYVNKKAERLFGHAASDVLGKPITLLMPERLHDAHRRGLQRFLSTGEPNVIGKTVELAGRKKDGSEFPFELSLASWKKGEETFFTGIIRDITERKRTEEQLHKAKEVAEAASRAKSEFLANMSHEIRTPMNGIMGMTELVLDTDLTAEQREYLGMVKASSDSLLSVINDILDFSKIEAGRLDFEAIRFSLRDSLGETIKTLSLRAHQKGLELAYHIPPSVPDALLGDPSRLRQIVVNLVGNAIKFTERGEVVIQVETESQSEQGVCLHFAVTDTGMGIATEKQRVIFEAFTQADGSMARKYGGTGLGLTISYRLVERMGGRMWLDSALGKGSTFHFTACFGRPEGPAISTVSTESINLCDLAVLVVDDNATNRRILQEMLKNWQMRPTPADGGRAALSALEHAKEAGKPFPLVLLDAQMPEMDGFTLAERIKQNPNLAGATIMMLTSAGQRGDAARCRELGIAAYLTKPIQQSELLEAIRIALGAHSRQEPRPVLITRHTLRESRQRLQILLAEDNAVNQVLAVRLLEKRGHSVTVVENGKKVLATLEQQPFDLLLMDVQMPEMDGFETTAVIRERERATGAHVPIIAMTAYAMEGDQQRCLAAGMDAYVSKPIQAKELLETVEAVIRSAESYA
ncbi:MAG: PAS domain S-box protein [Acidobacteria bacterium]|nr:PAS domain S-box protein [Acidobacteriota bacterium]